MTALGLEQHTGSKPWRSTAAVVTAATVLAVGLAGCGSNSSTKTNPHSASSPASSPSSSAAGGPDASTLKTVTTDGAQIQVPTTWHVSQESNGPAGGAQPPPGSSIPPAVFALQASPDPLGTTASHAQTALRHAGKSGKRLSDLHVNGVTLYHVQYTTPGFFRDDFGAVVNGVAIHITWNFTTVEHITRAKANAYMNPVMATFKLTS